MKKIYFITLLLFQFLSATTIALIDGNRYDLRFFSNDASYKDLPVNISGMPENATLASFSLSENINGAGYKGSYKIYINGNCDLDITLTPSNSRVVFSEIKVSEAFEKFKQELSKQGIYYQNKTAPEVIDCFTRHGEANPLILCLTTEEKIKFITALGRYIPEGDVVRERIVSNILLALNKGK